MQRTEHRFHNLVALISLLVVARRSLAALRINIFLSLRRSAAVPRTTMAETSRPPVPPFTLETAIKKVKAAEDAWNTCDPKRVATAYTPGKLGQHR